MAKRLEHKVIVSIINWNNSEATNLCLLSISKIEKASQPDIVLIDNNSQKQPLVLNNSILKNLKNFKLIKNSINKGFAAGHNDNIKRALSNSYDFIFLLNNDVELLDNDLFDKLCVLLLDKNVAGVSPKILSKNNKDVWYGGGTYSNIFGHTKHVDLNVSSVQNVNFVSGCCLGINLKLLGNKALFSEDYFLYWEDTDWSVNKVKEGYTLLYNPNLKVSHDVSSSLGHTSSVYAYYNIRNSFLFMYRCVPWYFWPTTLLRNHYVLAKYVLLNIYKNSEVKFSQLLRAWWDGLRNVKGPIS